MLRDLTDSPGGQLFEADVCVIGGGAAGITIALEFANSNCSLIVLESGGLELDRHVQSLYEGVNTRGDFSLDGTRFRFLGGTTCVWGGWCAPMDDIDFQQRDWVPFSGWPITKQQLLPHYDRAQKLCELGAYRYAVGDWPGLAPKTLALDPNKLEHRIWQLSPPTHFGRTYLPALRHAPNVTVLLNATATEIVTGENARAVTEVRVASLNGLRGRVRARVYVIACGGIETARLLLVSNRVEARGLANRNDLVGRFFMEHPHPDAGGVFISGDIERFRPYFERQIQTDRVVIGFGPTGQAQQRLRILNSSVAVSGTLHVEPTEGWDSLMKLARAAKEGHWPQSSGTHLYNVLRDLDGVIREGYRRARSGPVRAFSFAARSETAPNPSNRVTLTSERDALGLNRVRVEWRLGDLERITVEKTMMLLAAELGRLGIGRVRLNELLQETNARWSENLTWFGHHMGTTRMSPSPSTGVVDPDCRVHGLANLYIASSSVFPTVGFANPTLTILALAHRLAGHIRTTALLKA